jgi:hypothetical protein
MEIRIDNVKMMRETLCIAQTAINEHYVNWSTSHVKRLGELIRELDKHRPVGPDGKHGDRHTPTCGCKDK